MKLLHTSDWHLGVTLCDEKRTEEIEQILQWLLGRIEAEQIDTLLIAGDIFNSSMPDVSSQEQYYRFLERLEKTCCRNLVIIAGNHDSALLLEAPAPVLSMLETLKIHIVGTVDSRNPNKEILILHGPGGRPELILGAVPYLRDGDVRRSEFGETSSEKTQNYREGIRKHYQKIGERALEIQAQLLEQEQNNGPLPILVTGHLYVSGGKTADGDGVRSIVGTLDGVGADIFPACADYVALGHLHIPQTVAQQENIRYSGTIFPVGFGEINEKKEVVVVDFSAKEPVIKPIPVPRYVQMEQIKGPLETILHKIEELKQTGPEIGEKIYLDIECTEKTSAVSAQQIYDAAAGSGLKINRILRAKTDPVYLTASCTEETLDDLTELDIFQRCLEANDVDPDDRVPLIACYQEILQSLNEEKND